MKAGSDSTYHLMNLCLPSVWFNETNKTNLNGKEHIVCILCKIYTSSAVWSEEPEALFAF